MSQNPTVRSIINMNHYRDRVFTHRESSSHFPLDVNNFTYKEDLPILHCKNRI